MTVNYQDLGLRVRDARKAKHLTQEQLAEKVGISSSFMGHIERGTRIASIDTLVSVCDVRHFNLGHGFSIDLCAARNKRNGLVLNGSYGVLKIAIDLCPFGRKARLSGYDDIATTG